MAKSRSREPSTPQGREPSLLGKTCRWLAWSIADTIQVHTRALARSDDRLWVLDRLEASLEAYAQIISKGDLERAERIVHELEVPRGDSRLQTKCWYQDIIENFEGKRYMVKYEAKLRRRLSELEGTSEQTAEERKELRTVRHELKGFDERRERGR